MLAHLTVPTPRGEKLSSVLHVILAGAFGLLSLHAAWHILAGLA